MEEKPRRQRRGQEVMGPYFVIEKSLGRLKRQSWVGCVTSLPKREKSRSSRSKGHLGFVT
jgi:hypothetical protein